MTVLPPAVPPRAPRSALRRVLFANDEGDLRSTLARAVAGELRGCAIECAGSFAAALDSVRRRPPDALLIHVSSPGETSIELLRALRATRRGAELVIVMMMRHARPDDWLRLHEAGADHCVLEPFEARELVDCMAAIAAPRSFSEHKTTRDGGKRRAP